MPFASTICFGLQLDDGPRVGSDDKKDILRRPLGSLTIIRARLVTVWSRPEQSKGV